MCIGRKDVHVALFTIFLGDAILITGSYFPPWTTCWMLHPPSKSGAAEADLLSGFDPYPHCLLLCFACFDVGHQGLQPLSQATRHQISNCYLMSGCAGRQVRLGYESSFGDSGGGVFGRSEHGTWTTHGLFCFTNPINIKCTLIRTEIHSAQTVGRV